MNEKITCTRKANYLCMKKMICTKKLVKKIPPLSELKDQKKQITQTTPDYSGSLLNCSALTNLAVDSDQRKLEKRLSLAKVQETTRAKSRNWEPFAKRTLIF